ncbi:MAG: plasmid stabilization protein [Pseudomonadota bacterium]
MPQAQWTAKRERQFEHIKTSLKKRGKSTDTAEEIAARTVNKERAQHGESKTANPKTLKDTPAPVRGGQRSHQGAQGRTRDQLYEEARKKGIAGRSKMNKQELEEAVGR